MRRAVVGFLLLCWCLTFSPTTVHAQTTSGRWAIGFTGGLNIWMNDAYGSTPGAGGTVDVQYGVTDVFSAGISLGLEGLRTKSSDLIPGQPFPYMKLYAIPLALDLYFNLLSGEIIAPFVNVGGGPFAFRRLGYGGVGLPDRDFHVSYLARIGVGVQAFRTDDISVTVELGYVGMDDALDRLTNRSIDGYVFGKIGVKLHLGEILHMTEVPLQTTAPLPILVIRKSPN